MSKTNQKYEKALNFLSHGEISSALPLLMDVYVYDDHFAIKALLHIIYANSVLGDEFNSIAILENAFGRYPLDDRWPAKLASIWMNQGDFEKALFWSEKALEINPGNEVVFLNRVCWLAARCDDPVASRSLFESWGERFMNPLTGKSSPLPARDLTRSRRLRLGYISGDFKIIQCVTSLNLF